MKKGIVKEYDSSKGFGFITGEGLNFRAEIYKKDKMYKVWA